MRAWPQARRDGAALVAASSGRDPVSALPDVPALLLRPQLLLRALRREAPRQRQVRPLPGAHSAAAGFEARDLRVVQLGLPGEHEEDRDAAVPARGGQDGHAVLARRAGGHGGGRRQRCRHAQRHPRREHRAGLPLRCLPQVACMPVRVHAGRADGQVHRPAPPPHPGARPSRPAKYRRQRVRMARERRGGRQGRVVAARGECAARCGRQEQPSREPRQRLEL
mmetsp:Transcript_16530/g.39683  ORF Transcript_16530/g.39683 Transcript_16530/m.39683 type:complete len:223 (+) Transcript_16530:520-1188(+)